MGSHKKNGKIEFLRFVFCCVVMIFHGKLCMDDTTIRIMFSGRLGVEFFFLVSGFLMAASLERRLSAKPQSVSKEVGSFLLKKVKLLYPMVVISFFMLLFFEFLIVHPPIDSAIEKIIKGVPNLFLIQQTGIQFYSANGTWYLSSMLLAMCILSPLYLKYHAFMKQLGMALIAFLMIGYLMQMTNGLGSPTSIFHDLTYRGNLRAISEIALGALTYEGAKKLKNVPFTKAGKRILLLVEDGCYGISLFYMVFHPASKYDYFILLLLASGVTISFSRCAAGCDWWDKRFFYFLGRSSLYIYLAHLTVARDLSFLLGAEANNKIRMLVYIVLSFSAAAFLWILSELCKRLLKKMRPLFITSA